MLLTYLNFVMVVMVVRQGVVSVEGVLLEVRQLEIH